MTGNYLDNPQQYLPYALPIAGLVLAVGGFYLYKASQTEAGQQFLTNVRQAIGRDSFTQNLDPTSWVRKYTVQSNQGNTGKMSRV